MICESCDLGDPDVFDNDLGGVDDLIRRPGEGSDTLPADSHDGVQDPQDIVIDPHRVWLERSSEPAVLDNIGVPDHRAGEVSGGQAIDGIGVPDTADVETVPDELKQAPRGIGFPPFQDDVGCGDTGGLVEVAATPFGPSRATDSRP